MTFVGLGTQGPRVSDASSRTADAGALATSAASADFAASPPARTASIDSGVSVLPAACFAAVTSITPLAVLTPKRSASPSLKVNRIINSPFNSYCKTLFGDKTTCRHLAGTNNPLQILSLIHHRRVSSGESAKEFGRDETVRPTPWITVSAIGHQCRRGCLLS